MRRMHPQRVLALVPSIMLVFLLLILFLALALVPSSQSATPTLSLEATIPIADFPQFLTVDPVLNRVYVDHAGSNETSVIDGQTKTLITTIPSTGDTGIAVNPVTHLVYVGNPVTNSISVIDGASDSVIKTIPLFSVPLGVAANPTTNLIYVSLGAGEVGLIDGATNGVVDFIFTGGIPTSLAVNPQTNQIYVADQLFPNVFVIDGTTHSVTTVPVSYTVGAGNVSVNTNVNRAYVISRDLQHIMVVDGTVGTEVGIITPSCCSFVGATAFDAARNVLYVNATTNVQTYNGNTGALLDSLSIKPTTLFGMGVNTATGELYSTALFSGYLLLAFGSDTTAPTISLPSSVTIDATSPAGAMVTYTVSANDPDDAVASLSCVPSSGTTFPIGTTTVTCTATDTHGNSASASFAVHVKGASEQLADLLTAVSGVGPGTSLADKVTQAQTYLAGNDIQDTCTTISAFGNEVKAQSGKTIPLEQALVLIASADRIKAVLGCN